MNYTTLLLKADSERDRKRAIDLLRQGELVALPTETVYGLAADARNIHAVNKIFAAKNRPNSHPLIVHIDSLEKLTQWATDISPLAFTLAQHFWPGPLTLLCKKASHVNTVVTGGLDTIALRVPLHPTFREILKQLDTGLAAPSANPHKKISPTTADHVMSGLSGKIAAVLDGGPCTIGVESTIVDVTGDVPRILRPGPITQKMLEEVLQQPVETLFNHAEKVAGNMAIHYRPTTATFLMTLDSLKEFIHLPENQHKIIAVMHYSLWHNKSQNVITQQVSALKQEYAQNLYKILHELDALQADCILIELPPSTPEWSDIHDRLSKAATFIGK